MKTVLVVGGAGYIGSHVNKELHRAGYATVVYDNLTHGWREAVKYGDFVLGDVGDADQLRLLFNNRRIDAVMHFSAYAYVGESVTAPEKYYQNNVANSLALLRVMRESGCNRLVFSSSCATYGVPPAIPIVEEHPQIPINPYGWSKLMVERILSDYARAYGLKYAALRYFNAAGADPEGELGEKHEPETHLIPLVLDAALNNGNISIFGTNYDTHDGTCVRDYVHVSDLADAHILALGHILAGGESVALNLGNSRGHSVREVINCAERITGRKISAVPMPRRAGDPPALVGSSEKIRAVLGWNPSRSDLDTIVSTAWQWLRRGKR